MTERNDGGPVPMADNGVSRRVFVEAHGHILALLFECYRYCRKGCKTCLACDMGSLEGDDPEEINHLVNCPVGEAEKWLSEMPDDLQAMFFTPSFGGGSSAISRQIGDHDWEVVEHGSTGTFRWDCRHCGFSVGVVADQIAVVFPGYWKLPGCKMMEVAT